MESKGLSQVLYLIIAAAVLMMVGLSLVLAFSSGTDTSGVAGPACEKNIELTCTGSASGSTHPLPGSCTRIDNQGKEQKLQGVTATGISVASEINQGGGDFESDTWTVTCE